MRIWCSVLIILVLGATSCRMEETGYTGISLPAKANIEAKELGVERASCSVYEGLNSAYPDYYVRVNFWGINEADAKRRLEGEILVIADGIRIKGPFEPREVRGSVKFGEHLNLMTADGKRIRGTPRALEFCSLTVRDGGPPEP